MFFLKWLIVEEPFVVKFTGIECSSWIMAEHPVFYYQIGHRCLRIFDKERIVTDTEAYDHVQVGLLPVQEFRLEYRITNGLMGSPLNLHLFRYTNLRFVHRSHLADDTVTLQSLDVEKADKGSCFVHQADAGGNSDFLRPDPPRIGGNLLDAC